MRNGLLKRSFCIYTGLATLLVGNQAVFADAVPGPAPFVLGIGALLVLVAVIALAVAAVILIIRAIRKKQKNGNA